MQAESGQLDLASFSFPLHPHRTTRLQQLERHLALLIHPDMIRCILEYEDEISGRWHWEYSVGGRPGTRLESGADSFQQATFQHLMKSKDVGHLLSLETVPGDPNPFNWWLPTLGCTSLIQSLSWGKDNKSFPSSPSNPPPTLIFWINPSPPQDILLMFPNFTSIYIFSSITRCLLRIVPLPMSLDICSMSSDNEMELFVGRLSDSAVLKVDVQTGQILQRYQMITDDPTSIAIYGSQIFVLSQRTSQIVVFDRMSGKQLTKIGHFGQHPGDFMRPTLVRVLAGQLFVMDGIQSIKPNQVGRLQAFD